MNLTDDEPDILLSSGDVTMLQRREAAVPGEARGRRREAYDGSGGTQVVQADAARDVAEEMRLDPDQMLVLTLMQQLMIGRDLIAEKNATRAQTKKRFRDGFAQVATMAHWSRGDDLPARARESAAVVADRVPSRPRRPIEEKQPSTVAFDEAFPNA